MNVTDLAFAVVKFVKENDVAVVPIGWLSNGKCFWPPKKLQGDVLPLKRKPTASQTWEKHRVKILGFYGNLSLNNLGEHELLKLKRSVFFYSTKNY